MGLHYFFPTIMKNNYLGRVLLFAGLASALVTRAQTGEPGLQRTIGRNGEQLLVSGLKYPVGQVQELFSRELRLGPNDQLVSKKSESDKIGFTHEKYQQYFKGVLVEGAIYTVHSRAGSIETVSGTFERIPQTLAVEAALSEGQALAEALKYVGASRYMWQDAKQEAMLREQMNNSKATYLPKGELVVIRPIAQEGPEKLGNTLPVPVVAWKFNVYAQQPLRRDYIYVNAKTGQVVRQDAILKNGTFETRYSGTQITPNYTYSDSRGVFRSYLTDRNRGNLKVYNVDGTSLVNTSSSNFWAAARYRNSNNDDVSFDAYWGAQAVYDYWNNVHGRNSYDGQGTSLLSYVHCLFQRNDGSYTGDNAAWDGSRMLYGDGGGAFTPLTSLDVCAHEIGHGVCQTTANLIYENESGALNEGFSDIWGAVIENYKAPTKQPWLIGEEITRFGGALRSMSNPNSFSQPAYYQGFFWQPTTTSPVQGNDYGGVHTNSGVLNHWFFLLSTGRNGTNEVGNTYSVTGIGMAEAAQIAFRAESQYLGRFSAYTDARVFTIQAARDLYGAGSVQEVAVANAWFAVGVGNAYTSPPFAGFNTYRITAKHSGQALAIRGGNDNTAMQTAVSDNLSQLWNIQLLRDGVYKLLAAHSGQVLEIGGAFTNEGATANQWSYWGHPWQQWRIESVGGGAFRIMAQHTNQALEVGGGSMTDGASVNQWSYVGGDNQQWYIQRSGVFKIINKHSGQALNISGRSSNPGAGAIQWPANDNSRNQVWEIEEVGNGLYKLVVQHSGQVLEVGGGDTNAGALANQWSYVSNSWQQWRIESVGGGAYRIIAQHSNQALEVGGSSTATGASVNQWPYIGADNQQWYIQSLSRSDMVRTAGTTLATTQTTDASASNVALSLYPNPASTQLAISLTNGAKLEAVKITDIRGSTLLTTRVTTSGKIDISSLSVGIYFVTVSDGKQEYRQRFSKE